MLQGWKNLHLEQYSAEGETDGVAKIDQPAIDQERTFQNWYQHPIDVPGRWYLQIVKELFKENQLAKGTFIGLGRRFDLWDINCPVYLLAGASDIVFVKQAVAPQLCAEKYVRLDTKRRNQREFLEHGADAERTRMVHPGAPPVAPPHAPGKGTLPVVGWYAPAKI
jgi:poly-beta-hydroxyalkanoate depolymerase